MGFWGNLFGRLRKALLPACRAIRRCVSTGLAAAGRAIRRCVSTGLAATGRAIQITASYALTKLTAAGRAVIDCAVNNPTIFGVSSILIIGGILVIVVPLAAGFGPAGVVYGSAAAAWQASIGNVLAGSLFAHLQSLTMIGVNYWIGSAMISGGFALLVVTYLKKWFGRDDDSGKKDS